MWLNDTGETGNVSVGNLPWDLFWGSKKNHCTVTGFQGWKKLSGRMHTQLLVSGHKEQENNNTGRAHREHHSSSLKNYQEPESGLLLATQCSKTRQQWPRGSLEQARKAGAAVVVWEGKVGTVWDVTGAFWGPRGHCVDSFLSFPTWRQPRSPPLTSALSTISTYTFFCTFLIANKGSVLVWRNKN